MRTEWVSEQLQDVAERVILPRFGALGVGEVEETTAAVLYLADASFTTGHILRVDGGYVTGRA